VNWGCDFGCGSNGGASSTEVTQVASAAIAAAKPSGLNVIRWWMFPGEPNQFVLSDSGAPTALIPPVYQDIDAALRLAEQHDVHLVFVLFSSPTHIPSGWTTDEEQRQTLARTIGTLAETYRGNSRILAWEVFNEPEWDIWDRRASQADVVDTVNAITDEIHAKSEALVTVGSANIEALGMWVDSDLDFYQPHWYDPMGPRACARCTDLAGLNAAYGIDKPVVIGEFFASDAVDSKERYADFYRKGFAGAWGWSLLPDRTQDKLGIDLNAAREFANSHEGVGP